MSVEDGYLHWMPDDRGQAFAALMRDARKRAGLTQRQVIEQSGVIAKTTLVRWESGDAERPDPDQVRALCRFYGINPGLAAIALGYLEPADLEVDLKPGRKLDPAILEVISALEDPRLSDARKREWVEYLMYLRQQSRPGGDPSRSAG